MDILTFLDPVNLNIEKSRFLKDSKYNPIFHYLWEEKPLNYDKDTSREVLYKAVISQSKSLIEKYAMEYFQTDLEMFRDQALRIVSSKTEALEKVSIDQVIADFDEAFKFFGLKDYYLEVTGLEGFNFRPIPAMKKIVYSKHADFQHFSLQGEIKHEIVHIIRYENGKYNNVNKSLGYLPTEEGLATFVQDKMGEHNFSLFQHAAEYLASTLGIDGSFVDVYNYFISLGFNQELAWQRSIRHKFGYIDTSKPGDIVKPAMYFANSQKVKLLSNDEILKLFVGKISIADLGKVSSYVGLFPKEKIIQFFELSNSKTVMLN